MSKRGKLLERFRHNPKNVRYGELESLLLSLGFEKKSTKGSHMRFVMGKHILVVPFRKPYLKPVYIRQALQLIDEVISDLGDDE